MPAPPFSQQQHTGLIDREGDQPGHRQLEGGGKDGPAPAARFLLDVARAAAQGMYSRQKIIRQRALKGPKPIPSRAAAKAAIPASELALTMPNSTAQLETTTSLAEMPAMRATVILPEAQADGGKEGGQGLADEGAEAVRHGGGVAGGPKFSTTQMSRVAMKMVVPAFSR